jgi:hypothetical protein
LTCHTINTTIREEIRSELTRQGPDFRGSVRKLVANKGTESARVAAETLFQVR